MVAFGSLALVSLCLDSWSLPSTWHAVLEANGQLSTWLPRQLSRPDWLFFIMRATIMLAEPETKCMRFQIHNQYAHSRPALLTSYSKNLIRYVASYMQGDSAAHRRSLSVSRTSKFAQALVSCFLPFYARCCTADFAVGGDSLTLGGVLVELARSASTRGVSFAVALGVSKSEVESDFDNQCPICFQTGQTDFLVRGVVHE